LGFWFVSENLFLIPVFCSVGGEAMGGSVGREVLVNNSKCLMANKCQSIQSPARALKMKPTPFFAAVVVDSKFRRTRLCGGRP